jgi:hypothetical protein
MFTITEKTLSKSRLIVVRVTNEQGKIIAVHTSPKRKYIDKMISRYVRSGPSVHKYT